MVRHWRGWLAAMCVAAAWVPSAAQAQEMGPPPNALFFGKPLFLPNPEMDGPGFGAVSFLDSPVPYSHFRLRYDAYTDLKHPERGEYFWAKPGPKGPGVRFPETSVDYQELNLYLEHAVGQRLSFFAEAPLRFLHPDRNAQENGFADLQAGAKFAFIHNPSLTVTSQVTGYIPTGDASAGLSRHYFAVEPGLLAEAPVHDWITLNGQVSYYQPINGTDFAGEFIRYGAAVTIGNRKDKEWWITPVAEALAWTFLSGKEQDPTALGFFLPRSIRDETIVNGYLGVRFHLSEYCDIYGGYGRCLSNDQWARDVYRFEFRFAF